MHRALFRRPVLSNRHRSPLHLLLLGLAFVLASPSSPAADTGNALRPAAPPRKAAALHAPSKVVTRRAAPSVSAPASAPSLGAGVESDKIHLAAVITPGIDAARRAAWFETLRAVVTQHNNNSNTVLRPAGGHSAPQLAWQLHVWELQGASATWPAQLEAHWRKQPVLALASGLGTLWQPVDEFCQQRRVPCWFPSVDALPARVGAYSMYFQAGVRLEAAVLARHFRELPAARRPARLIQFYRNDAIGHAAAQALKDGLAGTGIAVEYRALSIQQPEALEAAIAAEPAGSAWMFWLRAADLARLGPLASPAASTFFSGRLAGGLAAVPMAWRERASVVFPFALDRKGAPAADEFAQWAQSRQLDVVDEAMQAETFYGLQILADALAESQAGLTPDRLLARGRTLLAPGSSRRVAALFADGATRVAAKGEAPAPVSLREHTAVGRAANVRMLQAHASEHSVSTGLYPDLVLEPGRPVASNGAYIVGFDAAGQTPVARTAWIVPLTQH